MCFGCVSSGGAGRGRLPSGCEALVEMGGWCAEPLSYTPAGSSPQHTVSRGQMFTQKQPSLRRSFSIMSFGAKYTYRYGYVERAPVPKNYTFHYFWKFIKWFYLFVDSKLLHGFIPWKWHTFFFFLLFTTETMVILYFSFFSWHTAQSVFSLSLYSTNTHPSLLFANIPTWTFERNLPLRHMKQEVGLRISGRKKNLGRE